MMDKLEIQSQQDIDLKKELEKIDWPIRYGNIRIQLRAGKPTLVTIERTVRLDIPPRRNDPLLDDFVD